MGSTRPSRRLDFEIAIICALTIEADAVEALFDNYWDDEGPPYDKAAGDPNAYSTGSIGRHNVVLAHMPGMGKANAGVVAAHCRTSYPNIKLALVVGICGVVPFAPGSNDEIVLGDIVVSTGVIQYDLGRQLPECFVRKDTLLDSLGRPNTEVRALLGKLTGIRGRKTLRNKIVDYLGVLQGESELAAEYPGVICDRLFEAKYRHVSDGIACEDCGCDGEQVPRRRLGNGVPDVAVHFGLIASGDTVIKSGEQRDTIAQREGLLAFEMEGAGVWDSFPCVVIKGACDYADSHKMKAWQRYAAATAASCMKAFLDHWIPSISPLPELHPASEQPDKPLFIVPHPKNDNFVGRTTILEKLQQQPLESASQTRVSLFGLGGTGKTQIALAYVYWLRETCPARSVFWVYAGNVERFRLGYASIAQEMQIPGYADPKVNVLPLVKHWLESRKHGQWLMVIDNADDLQLFSGQPSATTISSVESDDDRNLSHYLPECSNGAILVTTRNKQVGVRLTKGQQPIKVVRMSDEESEQLLRTKLQDTRATSTDLSILSCQLEHLPLALAQGAAFIQETSVTVQKYLQLLSSSDKDVIHLLSKEFETVGRDSQAPQAVAQTWILSFQQIEQHHILASELLAFISLLDRQGIPAEFLSHYSEQERNGGPLSDMELTEALGVLKAFSFVTEISNGSFDMHRLVQLVTRKWLTNRKKIGHFRKEALITVSQLYPYGEFENRTICAAYLSHATAILGLGEFVSREEAEAKAFLLHRMAAYFNFEGKWSDAEKLNTEAANIRKELFGETHPSTLTSMCNLASTFSGQGRWDEAETLEVQVLEARKMKLGADHPDTLTSMGNLASTFSGQGRWDEAETLGVQVLEARKKKLGADHPDTLTSMGNLASTFRDQGRWDEAETLEVQVLEARKTKLGADYPDTLTSMASLALTFRGQGRWDEAETLEVQVLETSKTKLGAGHPDTLTSMGNLASTFTDQGRWDEAETLGVQALEARKTKLGAGHPNTLRSMSNLALIYTSQGRWEEAETLDLQVLEARKTKLGADHPDTLTSMNNLAYSWHGIGRASDATNLMVTCICLRQVKLGLNHPDTQDSISTLRHWENG